MGVNIANAEAVEAISVDEMQDFRVGGDHGLR